MMKFAWRNNMGNLAAWNSSQVEEIEDNIIIPYKDLLVADQDLNKWDKLADKFHFE
jgi:hypothetical protein